MKWSVGVDAKGNEGMSGYVGRIKGSISYVEYAFALQNKLTYTALKNPAGNYAQPSAAAIAAAVSTIDWPNTENFLSNMLNAPAGETWPIVTSTWIIMYKQAKPRRDNEPSLAFIRWSLNNRQGMASALGFAPLPAVLVGEIEGYLAEQLRQ